ncbi:hypothetical protein SDC9_111744 [bioreactor metagenome]|uniref:Uncharacterized protein n=1 Tax=bioreactor metagenome TaxID=1076179 RepID=A0A645BNK0_9ZZZZ
MAKCSTIENDLQVLHAAVAGGNDFGGAGDGAHACSNRLGRGIDLGQVGTEDLDGHVASRAGQHLGHAHLDGLRKAVDQARKAFHHAADGICNIFLAATPLSTWLEHQKGVSLVEAHGIQPQIVRARARHDGADFRDAFEQGLLHALIHIQRCGQ